MKYYRFQADIVVPDARRRDVDAKGDSVAWGPRKFRSGQVVDENEIHRGCLLAMRHVGQIVELTPEEVVAHEAELKGASIHGQEQAPAPAPEPGKAKKK
jgi:hypothetical protein